MEIKKISELAERLFQDRSSYMLLCQEIAENFHPTRADFTVQKTVGEDFAADLNSSYPLLVRRELGDQIGQMLRPTAEEWFNIVPKGGEKPDNEGKRWMDDRRRRMRKAMYSRKAQFNEATKVGDHDFASFGECVISCRLNKNFDNLLYRCFHIRDVVWVENDEGEVVFVARKWKPYARDLVSLMRGNVSEHVVTKLEKDPFCRISCFHIVCQADMYSAESMGRPWFSLSYDRDHQKLMEEVPIWVNEYVIPTWQKINQYAFSPAAITGLADARMIQSMAFTLLEAGEKATNPPMVATSDVVRSDVSMYAGGITWVDDGYDERMGAALRPVQIDLRGLPYGLEMVEDSRALLAQAFFLNKLTLPQRAPEMTAYEVGQRIQEYIRGALPIFEPMEDKYNGGICDTTFETLLRAGVMGSPDDIPDSVRYDGIDFEYRSPLHDAIEEQKGQRFLEANALIVEAMNIDRGAAYIIDSRTALRDALSGVGVPADWMHSKDDVEDMVANEADQEQETLQLENMKAASEAMKNIGQAGETMDMI